MTADRTGRTARVKMDGVDKSYVLGDGSIHVLDGVSFDARDGEFVTLVGPSGCGKSTLLEIIAGLTVADAGSVAIIPSREAVRIGVVFQDPTLLDWRTVRGNLAFALRGLGIPREEHDARIRDALAMVDLSEFADQYPPSLSGGMRQRVGFARAFCVSPDVLLLDEPFSSLDELTARRLRRRMLDIWSEEQFTTVLVTHDIEEAVYFSDRVVVLSDAPATVRERVTVDMSRPRAPESSATAEYERRILAALGVET